MQGQSGTKKKKKKPSIEKPSKFLIGWREWVSLPDLRIRHIKAKIDTGAKTSSLHAEDIRCVRSKGRHILHFSVYTLQRDRNAMVRVSAELFDERMVRSSNGKAELRPVIITELAVFDEKWPIELTLANRDLMGFRMLLGREALKGRFLIDAEKSYLTTKFLKTKHARSLK